MIIWFDDAIFSGPVAQIDCLALLRQAALRRHTVLISADPERCLPFRYDDLAPHFSAWRSGLGSGLQVEVAQLMQKITLAPANALARANGQRILVSELKRTLPYPCCQIDVRTALHALAQPLHILVENQINDAAFLLTCMPADWRKKLRRWQEDGQLRFVQGGGITEIKKFIERYNEDQHSLESYGYPAQLWWFLHFLIYDHDGNKVEQPGTDAGMIDELLLKLKRVSHAHRLARRRQEHYLPIEAMLALLEKVAAKYNFADQDRENKRKKIEAFFALPESERFFQKDTPQISDKLKKNYFSPLLDLAVPVEDAWFVEDGSGQEMRLLAEKIAAML